MRGDRPLLVEYQRDIGEATPHARGSTSVSLNTPTPSSGYPACAGIDPEGARNHWPNERLPRMRGDRPFTAEYTFESSEATPHARGSTPSACILKLCHFGYPACAGIDPLPPAEIARLQRLPRMRGDRPFPAMLVL